jgi:hypothetical protein
VNGVAANRCYVRSERYAVMMTTSKSMAPIARRKKPKDGSGITALPLLLAFAIGSELQVDGLVPKQSRRKSQKAMLPMSSDRATVAVFLSERVRASGTNV